MSTTPRPDRDVAAEVAASHFGRRTFLRSAVLGGAAEIARQALGEGPR